MINLTSLDRTIFEYVRLAVVGAGYLPDWRLMPGATQADKEAAYVAAKAAIKGTGKEIIEVFGHGSAEAKLGKVLNRITVNRRAMSPGAIGLKNTVVYQFKGSDYGKETYKDDTVDVLYEMRLISDRVSYERLMYELMSGIFKAEKYLPSLNLANGLLEGDDIFVSYETYLDLSATRLIETSFSIRVQHVSLGDPIETDPSVPALTTINYNTYVVPLANALTVATSDGVAQNTIP